jgi:hypothetical protein
MSAATHQTLLSRPSHHTGPCSLCKPPSQGGGGGDRTDWTDQVRQRSVARLGGIEKQVEKKTTIVGSIVFFFNTTSLASTNPFDQNSRFSETPSIFCAFLPCCDPE